MTGSDSGDDQSHASSELSAARSKDMGGRKLHSI